MIRELRCGFIAIVMLYWHEPLLLLQQKVKILHQRFIRCPSCLHFLTWFASRRLEMLNMLEVRLPSVLSFRVLSMSVVCVSWSLAMKAFLAEMHSPFCLSIGRKSRKVSPFLGLDVDESVTCNPLKAWLNTLKALLYSIEQALALCIQLPNRCLMWLKHHDQHQC